jgi:hypothetical protein
VKLKAKVASTILIIDTFFLSFAYGFNSRHVLVVDPTLPPYVAKVEGNAETELSKDKKVVNSVTAKSDATKSAQTSTADGAADSTASPSSDSGKKSSRGTKHSTHSSSKKAHGTK